MLELELTDVEQQLLLPEDNAEGLYYNWPEVSVLVV